MTVRRNIPEGLSLVAGVIDKGGGLRIEIDESMDRLMDRVRTGERAFILPDLLVEEPLSIQQFFDMQIERAVLDYIELTERKKKDGERTNEHRRRADQQRHERQLRFGRRSARRAYLQSARNVRA